jgi:hypothetical protein
METFTARREVARFTHRVSAPPARVFPLLCPVREEEWIPGWSAQVIHSASGVAEVNGVFLTRIADSEALFIVTRHDLQAGAIEFVVLRGGTHVEKLDLALTDNHDGTTTITWTRTYTGLSEAGNAQIEQQLAGGFQSRMQTLHELLERHLQPS